MEVKSGCLLQPVRPPCSLFTLQSSSGVWVWRCSTVITQPILLSAAPYERSFETPVLLELYKYVTVQRLWHKFLRPIHFLPVPKISCKIGD